MTKEELKQHCEKKVKMCEEWAKGNGREPSGKIYEEHKLILDLITELEQQTSEDEVTITFNKGTLKHSDKGYVVYNKDWFRKHFATEVAIMTDYDGYLEQPTSEDCVSRTEVVDELNRLGRNAFKDDTDYDNFFAFVDNLPPATPTHGTCKDCTNYVEGALDEEICLRGHELIHKDLYCRDFEKRGDEE